MLSAGNYLARRSHRGAASVSLSQLATAVVPDLPRGTRARRARRHGKERARRGYRRGYRRGGGDGVSARGAGRSLPSLAALAGCGEVGNGPRTRAEPRPEAQAMPKTRRALTPQEREQRRG